VIDVDQKLPLRKAWVSVQRSLCILLKLKLSADVLLRR
jgi:hypothetical protein